MTVSVQPARYNLSGRWRVELDGEQIDDLARYSDNPAALRDRFEQRYKTTCLQWLSYRA